MTPVGGLAGRFRPDRRILASPDPAAASGKCLRADRIFGTLGGMDDEAPLLRKNQRKSRT